MPKKTTDTTEEEKVERIQHYELVYLISNKFSENELAPITDAVVKLIKDNGGSVTREENWGKKKLAYPIKQFFHAYYFIVEFDCPRENIVKLDSYLRLHEDVIRHLIVQQRIRTAEEIAHEKKVSKQLAEEQERAAEEKMGRHRPIPVAKAREEKKVSMEELDEKLNKILDDTESLL